MHTHRIPAMVAAASLVFLAAACSDDDPIFEPDQGPGSLAIQTHTTGDEKHHAIGQRRGLQEIVGREQDAETLGPEAT